MQLSGNLKLVLVGGVALVAGVAITIIFFVFWPKDSKNTTKCSESNIQSQSHACTSTQEKSHDPQAEVKETTEDPVIVADYKNQ